MASIIRVNARRLAPSVSFARSFSVSASSRKDLVQDLYISQLKNYKAPAQTKDAHVGNVRNYTAPSPPKAPVLPSNLAEELSKFDAEEPTLGASSTEATASSTEEQGESAQDYLNFLEADHPKKEHH
ncbi:ATP synthase complex subunit H-domain-containing protein [Kockovaella imperatae]|uniref:ATP synthase complex subunit H-domain-containing protein n=1 Tax=Kockovaella imperatae TaxID=4999 RepID=A0A1Y1U8P7_9TREE|nr:ATP synthase complex subunit H-domain-containing protein [Kockovaella imperatae]ORX34419.1 ATP synthase complex subunit H-domain-containing protein [Kockovaella imperatae]